MMEANLSANTTNAGIPPMPFGVTLERVYRILRDHLKVFLGIGIVPGVGMMLLYGAVMGTMFAYLWPYLGKNGAPPANPDPVAMIHILFPSMMLAGIAIMIPMMAVMAFYLTSAFHAANRIDSGIATTVGECYSVAWQRMGRSFVLLIWVYFRAFGLALAILCAGFGSFILLAPGAPKQTPSPALFAIFPLLWLLYMAAYVYGFIVAMRLSLAFPTCLEEGLTPSEAIRRSCYLTHGSKGRIFLLLLVVELIGMACFMVLYILGILVFVIGALGISALHLHPTGPWAIVVAGAGGLLIVFFYYFAMALIYGSMVVTLSVVYHDQRRRMDASLPAQRPVVGAELTPGAEPA